MSPDVQVAIITTLGAVIVGLLGYLGVAHAGLRRDAKATREQVQNSHSTNLRDDLDDVRRNLALVLDSQQSNTALLRSHGYELGHLRRDIQQERSERERLDSRFDDVLRRLPLKGDDE